jgi:hypothetical protein
VRTGEQADALVKRAHVPMDITGKPVRGCLVVAPEGTVRAADLLAADRRVSRLSLDLHSEEPQENPVYDLLKGDLTLGFEKRLEV